jgi:hypothetical protein
MTNAGLGLEVSREALVFLQHMHQAPQDLRLLKEMHKRAIGSEIYVAIVDVVRCAVADMLAVALQPKVALDKAIERRSVLLIGKIVSHLQRKRGMSVDGATRLCLKVGMGWLLNSSTSNAYAFGLVFASTRMNLYSAILRMISVKLTFDMPKLKLIMSYSSFVVSVLPLLNRPSRYRALQIAISIGFIMMIAAYSLLLSGALRMHASAPLSSGKSDAEAS